MPYGGPWGSWAERTLTAVMRCAQHRYLSHAPAGLDVLPEPELGRGYVLYAHVPFCERLCPYCSFNRFLFDEQRARDYFVYLRREMRMVAGLGYRFPSLYIGGGTPTILVDELQETITLARELFDIREVSCETSPNHLGPELVERLSGYVDRLSVGVQSFDDDLLEQMERYDEYGSGADIHRRLQETAGGFRSVNVDMIFNYPTQTEEVLRRDVELLVSSGADQVTFYPLMTSKRKAKAFADSVGAVDLEREAHFYRLVSRLLEGHFTAASAWTYARDVDTMIDEYIVDYDEYLGVGSGAMSHLGGRVYSNTFSLSEYAERIAAGRMSVCSAGREYSKHALMQYRFVTELFGLRLDKRRFRCDFGMPIDIALAPEMTFMRAAGAFDRDDDVLTLTERGRYLLVIMMREVLSSSNDLRDEARLALSPDEYRTLLGEPKPVAV